MGFILLFCIAGALWLWVEFRITTTWSEIEMRSTEDKKIYSIRRTMTCSGSTVNDTALSVDGMTWYWEATGGLLSDKAHKVPNQKLALSRLLE